MKIRVNEALIKSGHLLEAKRVTKDEFNNFFKVNGFEVPNDRKYNWVKKFIKNRAKDI